MRTVGAGHEVRGPLSHGNVFLRDIRKLQVLPCGACVTCVACSMMCLFSQERSEEFGNYMDFLETELSTRTVFSWKTPKECGLDESIFVDYGHMSQAGAVLYSRMLAKVFDVTGAL